MNLLNYFVGVVLANAFYLNVSKLPIGIQFAYKTDFSIPYGYKIEFLKRSIYSSSANDFVVDAEKSKYFKLNEGQSGYTFFNHIEPNMIFCLRLTMDHNNAQLYTASFSSKYGTIANL